MTAKTKRQSDPKTTLFADQGKRLPMALSIKPADDGSYILTATADLSRLTNPVSLANFYRDLNLRLGEREFRFSTTPDSHVYRCEQRVSAEELASASFELVYKDTLLDGARFMPEKQAFAESHVSDFNRLLVFEMKGLSRPRTDGYPFDRTQRQGFDPRKHSPLTDLHTHLTAQISAKDLIKVARAHHALYPVELLLKLGLSEQDLPATRHDMPAAEFVPTASEGLECEKPGGKAVEAVKLDELSPRALSFLERALAVPVDRVYTFDEIERTMYRFRNPFTKNDQLIEPVILKVAEDYAKQGVRYTEQAVTGTSNPKWLEKALPALEKAKSVHGVDMRFLVGIPRSLPPERMLNEIRKIKLIAHSPHIVGVDFLGYEANKTQNFHWALTQLAQWVSEQKADPKTGHLFDDFVLRVHAGETGKNLDNVYEAMKVANRFGIKLRIGHGIHIDMDSDFQRLAREMAQKGLIAVEFNPDSNISLNNIDFPTDIPVKRWRDLGVPCVLATDGAGAYRTTLPETAQNMLHAGLTLDDLKTVRRYEQDYIERQKTSFEATSLQFKDRYPDGISGFIADYKKLADDLSKSSIRGKLPDELKGRTPILIAGASGSSWNAVDINQQIETDMALRMLVELVDPEKAYFAVGRIKDEGVTHLLDQALSDFHDSHPRSAKPFSLIGLLGELQNMPRLPENLTHIWPLSGGLLGVPREMVNFLHQHHGHAVFIGGGTFTRDFISHSRNHEVPHGLMVSAKGASADMARTSDPKHCFSDAIGMIEHLAAQQPHIFREGVNLSRESLQARYDQLLPEVEERHMPEAAVALQKSFVAKVTKGGDVVPIKR